MSFRLNLSGKNSGKGTLPDDKKKCVQCRNEIEKTDTEKSVHALVVECSPEDQVIFERRGELSQKSQKVKRCEMCVKAKCVWLL